MLHGVVVARKLDTVHAIQAGQHLGAPQRDGEKHDEADGPRHPAQPGHRIRQAQNARTYNSAEYMDHGRPHRACSGRQQENVCWGGGGGRWQRGPIWGPSGGRRAMHACIGPGPLQGKQLAGQSPRHPPALHLPSRLALGRRMPGSERGQTPHQPCKHLSACITCLSVRHDVLLPRVSRHGCCPQVKRHQLPTPRHHGCAAIRRSMPEQERWVWRLISKGQTLRG